MTKPATAKLSATQHLVLASACAHTDGLATRPPQLKGAQAAKALAALLTAGLVKEVRAKPEMPVWRHDEQGRPMSIRILKAGRTAVSNAASANRARTVTGTGASEVAHPDATAPCIAAGGAPAGDATSASANLTRSVPGSKRTLIIALMRREAGATMDELTAATGWLPHTMRAALTGLRKNGIAVALTKGQSGAASTYRVETATAAAAA